MNDAGVPSAYHEPVLLEEVLESLSLKPGGIYVDGTLGGGGHAGGILGATSPDGVLVGIDRDDDALAESRRALEPFGRRAILVKGNYADLGDILAGLGIDRVDGIVLDLGVSSHQLEAAERGFSFSKPAPLDMRMDREASTTARELVNRADARELQRILRDYGEELMAGRIARAIVERRKAGPIETTDELAGLIASAMPARMRHGRIHPATRSFQALRIAVNDELTNLARGIASGIDRLKEGGRFAVITFHSLEDRMVKDLFRDASRGCTCPPDLPVCACGGKPRLRVIARRPIRPGEAEMERNPRARSAKLRTAERIGGCR
ncbi:MAG: 16S rRNA (cytosine(1402)-N(4))-methyltransferase RsmH [Syntrophales bacterium]|jgi:16S rRNA (cytosine1402-N4)-methyltransferase|nr:16S rRNA (cytosine(1402)-N(4))-methyltransferase RsmH [Syntrophales bacterium]